jgi:hypothetical protein
MSKSLTQAVIFGAGLAVGLAIGNALLIKTRGALNAL